MKEQKTIIEVKRYIINNNREVIGEYMTNFNANRLIYDLKNGIFIEDISKLAQEDAKLLASAINNFEAGFNKVTFTACKNYYEYDNRDRFLISRKINDLKYY